MKFSNIFLEDQCIYLVNFLEVFPKGLLKE